MNKNKIFKYVMTGALSLGVIGGAGVSAFAATNSTSSSATTVEQAKNVKASLDEATKQKAEAIKDKLKTQLADLGVKLPEKGDKAKHDNMFTGLNDTDKAKAQTIMKQLKTGAITQEKAQTQLADLGVKLPEKGDKAKHDNMFTGLNDTDKAKAQTIMKQLKTGAITQEKAQTQLADLGVKLPEKGDKAKYDNMFTGLNDTDKAKAQTIMKQLKTGAITQEKAQTQLAELGIKLPEKIKQDDLFANLDKATKTKAQAFVDEAKDQLAKLGINDFHFNGLGESTKAQ
ncbi:hypothetical protein SAMN04487777_11523 [Priestia aryabhattai B8W22]|uniref:hypothetical protein n=1 Tax=Priestia aryabhattai TaxID=412384 RepID=UPI000886B4BF|nr:hypothetical protein SAMN04487777_11523 [Priestia aryabhattai B8W22]